MQCFATPPSGNHCPVETTFYAAGAAVMQHFHFGLDTFRCKSDTAAAALHSELQHLLHIVHALLATLPSCQSDVTLLCMLQALRSCSTSTLDSTP
jgi:hypothetical protein